MAALGAPAEGQNPYEYYLAALNASLPAPADPTGFKVRLCILFAMCGYVVLASTNNFVVHFISNHLKEKKLWIFRRVPRAGGMHVISNHAVLSGSTGLCTAPVFIVELAYLWSAYFGDGSGASKFIIAEFAALPVAFFFGYSLSFATFQAYQQVSGGRSSRLSLAPWLEDIVFVGGVVCADSTLIVLVILACRASVHQWEAINSMIAYLASAAATWDGTALSTETSNEILAMFGLVSTRTQDFYRMAEKLAIATAVLVGMLIVINAWMIAFVASIHRYVQWQIEKLTNIQLTVIKHDDDPRTGRHSEPRLVLTTRQTGNNHASSTPSESVETLPTFVPVPPGSLDRRNSLEKPHPSNLDTAGYAAAPTSAVQFGDILPARAAPSRGKVRALSGDPDRLDRDQAMRLMAMMKAEQELLVMCTAVGVCAILLTIWAGWAVSAMKKNATNGWAENEALFTGPAWIFAACLCYSETASLPSLSSPSSTALTFFSLQFHALVEWRHLRPWRAPVRSSGSASLGEQLPLPSGNSSGGVNGGVNRGVSVLRNGNGNRVHVDVQVVTKHEVVELDEFERSIGLGRGEEKEKPRAVGFVDYDEEDKVWGPGR
ncbi:hypothetical protein JCM8097_003214 [Rhodosporidiobolus ruineniae]